LPERRERGAAPFVGARGRICAIDISPSTRPRPRRYA
jgi:hypothetical protein